MKYLIPTEYTVQQFQRSNQDTCLVQRPSVFEGEWVQPGDLLADCSASRGGELSLGQNILIAYLPWEGYNYEDAILISERLVYDDLYTSIHIEKYQTETNLTKYGYEEITLDIPDVLKNSISHLDKQGIVKVGSKICEGQILVGKVTPIDKKYKSPYQKLLYTILEKELIPVRDSSLRAPKGIRAKVIQRKIFQKRVSNLNQVQKIVHLYLAEKRRIKVGDKMAGRHGNKGIVSQILPREDMPYLPDGSIIDMVLNPLGVPSRMNVGQIYECLLGLAARYLGQTFRILPFDEIYGAEASRTLTFSSLYKARLKTGHKWLFNPKSPGKIKLIDSRTGIHFHQAVTSGISYMLKLVHLVDDKIHCLTPDHDVLTTQGWIPISKVTTEHLVATLDRSTGQLIYQNPLNILTYPNYKGDLYHIKNTNIDLLVTLNHRMLVTNGGNSSKSFADYQLIEAKDLFGKNYKYLKNAHWLKTDYQFILPPVLSYNSLPIAKRSVKMDDWLTLFGFWITAGWASTMDREFSEKFEKTIMKELGNKELKFNNKTVELTEKRIKLGYELFKLPKKTQDYKNIREKFDSQTEKSSIVLENFNINKVFLKQFKSSYQVIICQNKKCVKDVLVKALNSLGYSYTIVNDKLIINDKQLWTYLSSLTLGASNKYLPSWVWQLSYKQAQKLLDSLCLGDRTLLNSCVSYYTSSLKLADDVMRLALHAGWSANTYLHSAKGSKNVIAGGEVISNSDVWRVSLIKDKNNPAVNQPHNKKQTVQIEEIRSLYEGPVHCLTVPNEVFYVRRNGLPVWTGNSRSSGPYSLVTQQPLRGRSKFGGQRLGEMEVWALEGYGAAFTLLEMLTIKSDDITGRMTLWSNIILHNPIFIGTPESFKVLVCELQALCLDIGIFKISDISNRKYGTPFIEINHLLKLP